jgi:hypothetical protein
MGKEASMSILEIEQADASRLVVGPGMAGTLMTPEEFDAIDEVDAVVSGIRASTGQPSGSGRPMAK